MPVAIITGASEGFGRAVAEDLAGAGWDLVIDARTASRLQEAAAALRSHRVAVAAVPGDVSDLAHRAQLAAAADEWGRLDALVLNAGALGPSPLPRLADLPLTAFTDVLAVNTVAQLGLVQAALPLLRASAGAVVAVTSDAAVEAYEGWGGYGASKAAFEHLAAVLAVEEQGLDVYRLDPGDLRTRMHQDAFPGEDISDRPLPDASAPAVRHLLTHRPPGGRYRSADLLAAEQAAGR